MSREKGIDLHWLEGSAPALFQGATWGLPWERGRYSAETSFSLLDGEGSAVPCQSWPLALWPDGSLKWTAHAVAGRSAVAGGGAIGKRPLLVAQEPVSHDAPASAGFLPDESVRVQTDTDSIIIDNSIITVRIPRSGSSIIESIRRGDRSSLRNGRLVVLRRDRPDQDLVGAVQTEAFDGVIERIEMEQAGPVRAVVKIEGRHRGSAQADRGDGRGSDSARSWLPFTLRLYLYAGSDMVRLMHSFVFDGDENRDFIAGIGLRFDVPMRDAMHDRHVRFGGEGEGLWAEAVRTLTGLRRDPGQAIRAAQTQGLACPPVEEFEIRVRSRLDLIPCWGDFTLSQPNARGFSIRKRTQAGCGWIEADQGSRAAGTAYIGGASGGIACGLKDFWQRHPTQIDIRHAQTESAELTVWLWSPEAPAMDLRFYHDGMGMDSHAKELEGLAITYEDYEAGWGSAHGVARSSELFLWAAESTPDRRAMVEFAGMVAKPPLLVAEPERYREAGVFGGLWTLPDSSTPAKARLERSLEWLLDYEMGQAEQRHWYGFWHYGDVMHAYDPDRHVWRYDVGGYAWDNSELSTDLWLWYSFLRTGRADLFRFAEAMTRHTGEVDVHHCGRFAGLGSRHNVQHWGCSAKQARISTALYRRIYYYLTGDERTGDLMREQLDTDRQLDAVDPIRKLADQPPKPKGLARVNFGTDWCSLASAWLTEWERGGDSRYRDKLLRGMRDIGRAPHGFWSGCPFGYDAETGALVDILEGDVGVSGLSSVFGAVELCAELIQLTRGMEFNAAFEKAWVDYCELYNAPPAEQLARLPRALTDHLAQAHSRLSAYAAHRLGKAELAARAWREFLDDPIRMKPESRRLAGPEVLNPIDEAPQVNANDAAQWSLCAIQNLALIGEFLPEEASRERT